MEKKSFGTMIAEMRKQKGWTQLDLANKMGVTDKAVSKWERDRSFPDVAALPRLAELFGVSVDDLMHSRSSASIEKQKTTKVSQIINLILTAIPLAMGVAVVILGILKELDTPSALTMLGIGLICLAIRQLNSAEDDL